MSPGHGFGPRGGPNLPMVRGLRLWRELANARYPLPTLPLKGEG